MHTSNHGLCTVSQSGAQHAPPSSRAETCCIKTSFKSTGSSYLEQSIQSQQVNLTIKVTGKDCMKTMHLSNSSHEVNYWRVTHFNPCLDCLTLTILTIASCPFPSPSSPPLSSFPTVLSCFHLPFFPSLYFLIFGCFSPPVH